MKIRTFLILIIFQLYQIAAYTQILNGSVLDKNGKPIVYASIGIVDGNRGTISDEQGRFKIDLKNINKEDILRFSCLGFYPKDYKISSINKSKDLNVIMEENIFLLAQVLVYPKKDKVIEFGKKKVHDGGIFFFGSKYGIEHANLYQNKHIIVFNKFSFHISSTNYDSTLYRLNIYSNNNGLPGDNINQSQILMKSRQIGWNDIDLSSFKIKTKGDFFISVEAIKGWKDSNEVIESIRFSHHIKGSRFFRTASQGYWQKQDGLFDYYILANEE